MEFCKQCKDYFLAASFVNGRHLCKSCAAKMDAPKPEDVKKTTELLKKEIDGAMICEQCKKIARFTTCVNGRYLCKSCCPAEGVLPDMGEIDVLKAKIVELEARLKEALTVFHNILALGQVSKTLKANVYQLYVVERNYGDRWEPLWLEFYCSREDAEARVKSRNANYPDEVLHVATYWRGV